MYQLHFRKEFRRRLISLRDEIDVQLSRDEKGFPSYGFVGCLLPKLFAVYSLIWCKRASDFVCKKNFEPVFFDDFPTVRVSREFYLRARTALFKPDVEHDELPF